MNKEALLAMGLTEEQATKVMASLDGSYVTKDRFNQVNEESKQLKETVKERDKQLESLKAGHEDAETLKKTIEDLQAANKAKDEEHAKEVQQVRMDAAIEKALSNAKARNPITVKPLLKLDEAELLEDGTIKGLAEQLEALAKSKDTGYLFDTEKPGKPVFQGVLPGEKTGTPTLENTPSSLEEAVRMTLEANTTN